MITKPQISRIQHPESSIAVYRSTTVENSLQIGLFMQNKANLPGNQVNANSVLAKGYEADIVFWPKNPKANFLNGKMNISYAITKHYENVRLHRRGETKPNSKPIKPNSKPIKPNSNFGFRLSLRKLGISFFRNPIPETLSSIS